MSESLHTTQNSAAGQDRPELWKAIQEIVDSGLAGVSLRVNDERGEWVGSAGVAELGEAGKPPVDGYVRIGSNTKTFTATLVLQLVAEGKIQLDAPAADYLPEFALDRRITVRMLLQHTSGVFNFTGELLADGTVVAGIPSTISGQEWVDSRFKTYPPEDLVGLALSKPARFEPGTGWSYSNTNYVLARLLVEKVTGRSCAEGRRRSGFWGRSDCRALWFRRPHRRSPSRMPTPTTGTRKPAGRRRSTSPARTLPGSPPAAT